MPNEILPNTGVELPDVGSDQDTWGDILNNDLRILDKAVQYDVISKTLAGVDVTLTDAEAASAVINLTGTLTANVNVIVPATPVRVYLVRNQTSGAFTVTVKTAAGTGTAVQQGTSSLVYSDGTNIIQGATSVNGSFSAGNTSVANLAYTGTLTGGTGVINIGSGQLVKDAAGNVGLGTASPAQKLSIIGGISLGTGDAAQSCRIAVADGQAGAADARLLFRNGTDTHAALRLILNGASAVTLDAVQANDTAIYRDIILQPNAGNVGLGVATRAWASTRKAIQVNNRAALYATTSNTGLGNNHFFNGTNFVYIETSAASTYEQSAGLHAWFTAPSGTAGDPITFTQRLTLELAGNLLPGTTDNTQNIGSASNRWATVFAGTGTINTSDAREKTAVSALTAYEINAAKQLSKEIGTYNFLASVQAKGAEARLHVGMTVQRAIEIMQTNNLNPFAYGFICYDKWDDEFLYHPEIQAAEAKDAVFDENGNLLSPAVEAVEYRAAYTEQVKWAGDRYAFRYDQLNMFIAAGIEARLSALEAK